MFLFRLTDTLDSAGLEYAIAGGYAVALHGAVRGTVDVDLVIHLRKADFQKAEVALAGIGLQPRLPVTAGEVFDFREEFATRRNMLAWNFTNPSNPGEVVDILITENLADLKVTVLKVGSRKLPVVSRDDLIRMKTKAGRPQDLEDVSALQRLARKP